MTKVLPALKGSRVSNELARGALMATLPDQPIRLILFISLLLWGCRHESISKVQGTPLCRIREAHYLSGSWQNSEEVIIFSGGTFSCVRFSLAESRRIRSRFTGALDRSVLAQLSASICADHRSEE